MSKKSVLERNKRRGVLNHRFAKVRQDLKIKIKNFDLSFDEKLHLVQKLDSMPKDGSKIRYRKRCFLTGRPRGFIGDFGISRIKIREIANLIPGVKKGSW